ncbi:MAG: hypothetical protein WA542_10410 [Candidatus Acidiferrum sp.]
MQRDRSEETAHEIDREVKNVMDSAYRDSKQILQEHRAEMDLVAAELLQRETLDAQAFKDLISHPVAAR